MINLLQRPELLPTLLANMLDGLSVIDAEGRCIYVNDALCRMLGFAAEELIGNRQPFPYWPSDALPEIADALARTQRGDVANFELTFQRKDGTRVEVIVAPAALRDDSGHVIAHFATIKDISERKRLERSLSESEQRWRSVAENPFDFVTLIDRAYRYTYVNHCAPGITLESLLGRATPFDFIDPAFHNDVREAFETTFSTGRATSYEVHAPALDAWYQSVVGPVYERGEVTGLSILTRDITDKKRAEQTLRLSEQRLRDTHRMETIGTLAGGIAHDINNMLTPIVAYTDLASRDLAPEHEVQEHLRGVRVAADRARDLVQRILLFSRRQEPRKTHFDWAHSIREDIMLLRPSVPAHVELALELPQVPVPLFADRAQMSQVITNLATNALHAMAANGGVLTIALRRDPMRGDHSLLTVQDTGTGMDAETVRRAFDPFFTTKPVGGGTGLGLSIVHSVVREHGGDVTLSSNPGQGTTVVVRMPNSRELTEPARSPRATQEPVLRTSRVIVVDDETTILRVTQQALQREGCVVTTASSAIDALRLFEQDPAAFDLLLTDQSMPRMTGTALVAELRARNIQIPVLLMTGHGDEQTLRLARELGVLDVIAKPFSVTALLAAIEGALRQPHLRS